MNDTPIDMNRLKEKIVAIGAIGQSDTGGINRIFGSSYMSEAQIAVKEYMEEAGLTSWIDSLGNVHGVLKSENSSAKTVLVGSHIDTVDNGGLFDGLLGVVGAIECVRSLQTDKSPLKHNIHVLATNGEEGNELGGTFGSRAMMGLIDLENIEYLEKAKSYGYSKEDFQRTQIDTTSIKCFMELHIEQGPTLDTNHEDIGIVTGIVGLERYSVEILGVSNHAGTTMMEYREDALVKASEIILEINQLAKKMGHSFVATVGKIEVYPNAVAVIPGSVKLTLEIRNQSKRMMEIFMDKLQDKFPEDEHIKYITLVKKEPVDCDSVLIQCLKNICCEENIKYRLMPSGATHDGNAMALKMPIAMIFVPSKDGISHSPLEWTTWEQIHKGVNILYKLLVAEGASNEAVNH